MLEMGMKSGKVISGAHKSDFRSKFYQEEFLK